MAKRKITNKESINNSSVKEYSLNKELSQRHSSKDDSADYEIFHSAFEFAGVGMAIISLDGNWIKVNSSFCRIIGYTEAELVGTNINSITHPEDLTVEVYTMKKLVLGNISSYQIEKRYIHKEGHIVWVLLNISLAQKRSSHAPFFIAQIQDINRQKATEQILKEKHQQAEQEALRRKTQMEKLIEDSFIGVIVTDREGRIINANNAFLKMMGFSRGDLLQESLHWIKGTPQEYREKDQLCQTMLKQYGTFPPYQKEYLHKNGQHIPIMVGAAKFEDIEDLTIAFIVDLTELRQADIDRSRLAALVESAHNAIFIKSLENIITFWNAGAERIYGYTEAEILGQHLSKLVPTNLYHEISYLHHKILDGEYVSSYETRRLRKDGTEIWISLSLSPIKNRSGEIIGISSIAHDITEQKTLEQQVQRAQRIESIGVLAGGIAHDLNNILSPLLMFVHLLKKMSLPAKETKLLDTITICVQRGEKLVKQILMFARGIEENHTVIEPVLIVSEVVQIFKMSLPNTINIELILEPSIWRIKGDATKLHQILMNLCINSRDAMPDGGTLTITVKNIVIDEDNLNLYPNSKIGSYVMFKISDCGIGIDTSIQSKIFDPFFTTKLSKRGTGLGLSTVKNIIDSHNGFINLFSEAGKGTEISIYLPAMIKSTDSPAADDLTLLSGNKELLLVIDDEAAICQITKMSLEAFNYNVITANDGLDALNKYQEHQDSIRLILVDLMMPSIEGNTAIQELQRRDPSLKIIATTGLPMTQLAQLKDNPNIAAYLSKPYSNHELLYTVQNVLNLDS